MREVCWTMKARETRRLSWSSCDELPGRLCLYWKSWSAKAAREMPNYQNWDLMLSETLRTLIFWAPNSSFLPNLFRIFCMTALFICVCKTSSTMKVLLSWSYWYEHQYSAAAGIFICNIFVLTWVSFCVFSLLCFHSPAVGNITDLPSLKTVEKSHEVFFVLSYSKGRSSKLRVSVGNVMDPIGLDDAFKCLFIPFGLVCVQLAWGFCQKCWIHVIVRYSAICTIFSVCKAWFTCSDSDLGRSMTCSWLGSFYRLASLLKLTDAAIGITYLVHISCYCFQSSKMIFSVINRL